MAEVSFHPEAQAEYQAALAWYLARSQRAGSRFEDEVDRLVGVIAANPESYPAYDDDHRFAVLTRYPYSLVYRVEQDRVYVVAVAHSARRPGYWQGRV